jgi:hypothetical protein
MCMGYHMPFVNKLLGYSYTLFHFGSEKTEAEEMRRKEKLRWEKKKKKMNGGYVYEEFNLSRVNSIKSYIMLYFAGNCPCTCLSF